MSLALTILGVFILPTLAFAASPDMPRRKSGLWEIRVSSADAGGTHSFQQCVNEKTDDMMKNDMQGMEKSCSQSSFRREGDKIVYESTCKIEGSTARTRSVIAGRFDSAYTVDSRSTYDPPMHGIRESSMKMDAKWLSACKAGQKPGDVLMPGVPGINMDELMKNLRKQP